MIEQVVIIGGSAGSLQAVLQVAKDCPSDFKHPIVFVLHRGGPSKSPLAGLISDKSNRIIREVEPFDRLENYKTFLAPTNYHLLVGEDHHLELDLSEKVLFSRPSIDVSFGCFAHVYKQRLTAVVLSGANRDGAEGASEVLRMGGQLIVQSPNDAEVDIMPTATLTSNPKIENIVPTINLMHTIQQLTHHRNGRT